jgi:hypothetical protein
MGGEVNGSICAHHTEDFKTAPKGRLVRQSNWQGVENERVLR